MFLMSCGVLNVKVYIYVARSLLDYHGNWGSMLEVSGRQRDLDEPCECGRRDGERETERERWRVRKRESDRGNGSRWRKVRKRHWNAQRSFVAMRSLQVLLVTSFASLFIWYPLFPLPLLWEKDICSLVFSQSSYPLFSQHFQFGFSLLCPCLLPSLILFSSFSLLSSYWRDVSTHELTHQNMWFVDALSNGTSKCFLIYRITLFVSVLQNCKYLWWKITVFWCDNTVIKAWIGLGKDQGLG